ncbi:MAG: hypothetical protein H6R15_3951 [Proteobacteria bacterium]|nr:hypothetical protein [Pseudomonadota bacterium]
MHRALLVTLLALAMAAGADETLPVCYGYGCLTQADVRYHEGRLRDVGRFLRGATDAAGERERLALVIGRLYAWAGEQSAIRNDRGGNYADQGVSGQMDCIDHSTSTTRLLKMLEARHYLRWHRVLGPDVRYFAFVFPAHYSAVIEETKGGEAARFVVDSWFVDNGQPAVILPLDEWKRGAGPDV